ncbi:hypothetical protein [Caenimonas aquaedulcis]|uniref:Uncharacterized protein n=1 Tax=Caenimonas aquaedulcis TaxID=2793270 RepID=A0A931H541_9BURK|nr:hypothetical protein [Caenimonas aquaedulcis]MBG9388590.1 hypothetical protein [Caenimonas aquaedulcis]
MTKTLSWAPAEAARPFSATLLHLLAALLRGASEMLDRVAARESAREAARAMHGVVEFHALHRDAGAPEGALYVNGELVGFIAGVKRL